MQPKRVLVADEQTNSRELLRILLEHEGCVVTEASDGLEAVDMARATLPDLVLLNLSLPGLDGYAAARAMRCDARLKSRSIVALTDGRLNSDRDRLRTAGFTGYITKPVVLRELSAQLTGFLPARRGMSL
jgi:two-component system cell cycle response regulator DivK